MYMSRHALLICYPIECSCRGLAGRRKGPVATGARYPLVRRSELRQRLEDNTSVRLDDGLFLDWPQEDS